MLLLRDESNIDFQTQCVIMTLANEGWGIVNDVLKMRKVISNFKVYVLLQPNCAVGVSVVIVVDK